MLRAAAIVSCASADRAPWLIAPDEKRFAIAEAGSTESSGKGEPAGSSSKRSRSSSGSRSLTVLANFSYSSQRSSLTARRRSWLATSSPLLLMLWRRALMTSPLVACCSPCCLALTFPGFSISGSWAKASAIRSQASASSSANPAPPIAEEVLTNATFITSSASPIASKISAPQ